jgi:RNA polymerase sigma factor (sigma-70 family)
MIRIRAIAATVDDDLTDRGARAFNTQVSKQALPPFQQLLERHSDDVWRTLRAIVGAQSAEDCFQETFLAALGAYPRLRADSNPRAWLLTIAHNKAIDHLRRSRRHEQELEDTVAVEDPPGPDREVWAAVAALPERQRAAVALRYVGDLSHREIAAAIGCTEEASRRSLHDGLTTLRRQL